MNEMMNKQEQFDILQNNLRLMADLINIDDSEQDILRLVSEIIKYSPKDV